MSETLIAIAIALIGVVVALVGSYATVRSQVRLVQKDNQLLYLWNRQLVDQIYTGKPPPPADPPPGLFIFKE